MAPRYVITEFNFDHSMRGWSRPRVFLTEEEPAALARAKWEREQNKYVLDTYGLATDFDYRYDNWFKESEDGAIIASSREYDEQYPRFIMVQPTCHRFVVFHAHEDEYDSGSVSMLLEADTYPSVYSKLLHNIAESIHDYEMKSPVVRMGEKDACLYEENFTDENYYQIVDTDTFA